jgi:uncharacterized protein YydD (DUF2326 family)
MCRLQDFSESQLRLIQDGITQQISENNNQLYTLEDIYEYSELSKNPSYLERRKKKDDLYQVATQVLEALVKKRVDAIVTYN